MKLNDLIPEALRRYDDDPGEYLYDPLISAIDKGGGQACDIRGVLVALRAAGFAVIKVGEK